MPTESTPANGMMTIGRPWAEEIKAYEVRALSRCHTSIHNDTRDETLETNSAAWNLVWLTNGVS